MLYTVLKIVVQCCLYIFCKRLYYNTVKYKNIRGPLLLAVNHPNSFFDAILLGAFFKQPVHYLARGDAFKRSWALKILTKLHCIPVYRLLEGKQYLHLNDATFERCRNIFAKGGIILIFSEGLCENEWNLRPLKKGTARLALSSWLLPSIGNKLTILPIGINYSSFTHSAPTVYINFGTLINSEQINLTENEGIIHAQLNTIIKAQLAVLCIQGLPNTIKCRNLIQMVIANKGKLINHYFYTSLSADRDKYISIADNLNLPYMHYTSVTKTQLLRNIVISIVLLIPSIPALLTYLPLYMFIKKNIARKALGTGHYHAALFGVCGIIYPLLQPLVLLIFYLATSSITFTLILTLILLISTYILKYFCIAVQRICNFNKLTIKQKILLRSIINL